MKPQTKDFLVTAGILVVSFLFSLVTESVFKTFSLVPMVFVLGVFLISVTTTGYLWGTIASMIATLAVNFAFTFPYFEFNFSIPVNLFSAVVMLVVAVVTGTLTTKIKNAEKLKSDSEREKMRANLLRAVSHDLRTPLTTIYGSTSMLLENFDRIPAEDRQNLLRGIRAVWGTTDDGSIKKLQVNMANIRKKLGERRYISNELGVGYRMISDDE